MKKEFLFLLLGMLAFAVTPLRASSSCGSVGEGTSPGCALSTGAGYYGTTAPSFVVSHDGAVLDPVALGPSFTLSATIGDHGVGMAVGPSGAVGGGANGRFSEGGYPAFFKVFFNTGDGPRWASGWTWAHGFSGVGEPGSEGFTPSINTGGSDPLAVTPEPFTLLLFGTGLLLIAFVVWRRDKAVFRARE